MADEQSETPGVTLTEAEVNECWQIAKLRFLRHSDAPRLCHVLKDVLTARRRVKRQLAMADPDNGHGCTFEGLPDSDERFASVASDNASGKGETPGVPLTEEEVHDCWALARELARLHGYPMTVSMHFSSALGACRQLKRELAAAEPTPGPQTRPGE